ncbi:hypothetical protein EJV47_20950 [Hymenobacter gummosus]|uniref:Gliding motility-associated C-terminal domain-containing protein n=1 Tax=Hymenobacter gummosus TaxID=1776032 RepID=A0A431TXX3_9BACT|nr:gliding motility-associated C-terminal domain-containing protein [Hymenobacter gummosus]RTQ46842.1 hypothetical protein EJV47_20950 [Hymenobacter gummosus]
MPLRLPGFIFLLLLLFGLWHRPAAAQAPPFDLAVRLGAPLVAAQASSFTRVTDVAVDAAGNSYVTGYYSGSVQLGRTNFITISGANEMFVSKLDAAGNVLWSQVGGSFNAHVASYGLALDAAGNLYVAGQFLSPTALFGNTTLVNADPTGASGDVFVGKLNSTGIWQWAVRAGGPGADQARDLAVDAAGTVYVTGHFASPRPAFGSTVLVNAQAPRTDAFAAQLDAQGQWRWAVRAGGTGADEGTAVAVDARGNAYFTGSFGGSSAGFGPVTLTQSGVSAAFVASLDAGGTYRWAVSGGGNSSAAFDGGHGIAVNAAGGVFATGRFQSSPARFGPTTLTNAGSNDVYVAKLDDQGRWLWTSSGGGPGSDVGKSVVPDAYGGVYLAGIFDSPSAVLGATALSNTGLHYDVLAARLDAQGHWRWARSGGGNNHDDLSGLAVDAQANLYLGGIYESPSISFGPFTLPGQPQLFNASGFLARPAATNTAVILGDSLLCGGGPVQLTAGGSAGATGYLWSTGATTSSISVTQPGLYSVTVSYGAGPSSTAQFRVRPFAGPAAVSISGDSLLCPGAAALLTATAPGSPSYLWSTGATTPTLSVTQPGTYSVTVRYGGGCSATAQYAVRALSLRIQQSGGFCVPGRSVGLQAVAPGATGYQWSTGATSAYVSVLQPGRYSVTATFGNGCQLSASTTLTRLDALIQGDTTLCPGQTVTLTASLPGGAGALTPSWSTGVVAPSIVVSQPGVYSVLIPYGPANCAATGQIRVRAGEPLPFFTLGPDTTICENDELLLRAPSLNVAGTLRWSDGSTGPTLRVGAAGRYSLAITNACGVSIAYRQVERRSCVFIPNVVTPNGDGQNDQFAPQQLPPGPWTLEVYSRWGQQVFRSPDYRNSWGPDAAPGVYYYLLRQAGTARSYKGWVEVVR